MKKHFTLIALAFMLIAVTITCKKDIHVTGVKLNETSLTLEVDETETLIATVFPENAANQFVIFKSSNPIVATVTSDGLVTALSKGVTIIEAITVDGNFSAKCTVQVDESFVIEATDVRNSSADIVTVCAMVFGEDYEKELASTEYQNNSFKLKLPSTVNDKYLLLFGNYYYYFFKDFFEDFDESWMSDKNAKITLAWPTGWDEDKNFMGTFIYLNCSNVQGFFLYADRNFTVKGEEIDQHGILSKCDCAFSKGWNFLYYYSYANYDLLTTTKPSYGCWYWRFLKWPEGWKKSSNKTNTRDLFGMIGKFGK